MANLLHIDSSFAGDASVSRAIGRQYVEAWLAAHPDGVIIYRDLALTPPPHLDWVALSAAMTPEDERTPEQTEAVKLREELVTELETADEYLLTVPMYNWSIPSTLKSWIDQVIVVGRTSATADGRGPLTGKKVTVVITKGGSYAPGAPKEGWDHITPYLAHVLEALGATDAEFVDVEMTLAQSQPALAQFIELFHSSRAAAEEAVRARAVA